jgi:hypothetical protein
MVTSAEMSKCAGCDVTRYCSRQCQKEAWPEHKEECRRLQVEKKKKAAEEKAKKKEEK